VGSFSDGIKTVNNDGYQNLPGGETQREKTSITDLESLGNGFVLASTYGDGILLYDKRGVFVSNLANPEASKSGVAVNQAYCIEPLKDHRLLVGTVTGLAEYVVRSNEFHKYSFVFLNRFLLGHRVYSVHYSSTGSVYAGTGSSGVFRSVFNAVNGEITDFELVETSPPLPDQTIYAIEEDDQGMIWMSTNKGLIRLNPANDHITIFDRSDGLQDDEFNIGASFKDSSGYLYFGGINGFNRFNPSEITVQREPPILNLTDIHITNTPVSFDPAYFDIPELVLGHDDHSVDFEFSNMDLVSPKRGHYKYMLENFDESWIDIGSRNTATFTNLPSGEYTFRVVGANADGVWNYDGIALPIRVLPAPWLTWWAFTAYGALVSGALLLLKRFNDTRLLKEEATSQARLMSNTATRAMDELQDQLRVERRRVGKVREHAAATIDAIEEMMMVEAEELSDQVAGEPLRRTRQRLHCLRALEQGVCFHADRLEICFRDVADTIFAEVMADAPATDCEIVLANDSVESLVPVDVATPLTLITHELVLNSVTHAFEGAKGVHCVVISLQELPMMQGWTLEVSDTGCGLPENVDPMQPTTLGMELVHRNATRLGASFEVSADQGTCFRFEIPSPWAPPSAQ
jgi:two-component sensor histidine kinase